MWFCGFQVTTESYPSLSFIELELELCYEITSMEVGKSRISKTSPKATSDRHTDRHTEKPLKVNELLLCPKTDKNK